MLGAAFVSYAGPFNMSFRQRLVHEKWYPDLCERNIPITQGIMPLDILSNQMKKVGNVVQTHFPESCNIKPSVQQHFA